jgi:hypothetical protein
MEPTTTVTILMRKVEGMGGKQVRVRVLEQYDVGSQFPTLGHQSSGVSQPSVVRYAIIFPTSCVILCMPSERDVLACFERLTSGPGVMQRLVVILPVYLLLF